MKYIYLIVLSAWSFLWIGNACAKIGDVYNGGVYDWHLPLAVAAFLGVPAVLGFLSGYSIGERP